MDESTIDGPETEIEIDLDCFRGLPEVSLSLEEARVLQRIGRLYRFGVPVLA